MATWKQLNRDAADSSKSIVSTDTSSVWGRLNASAISSARMEEEKKRLEEEKARNANRIFDYYQKTPIDLSAPSYVDKLGQGISYAPKVATSQTPSQIEEPSFLQKAIKFGEELITTPTKFTEEELSKYRTRIGGRMYPEEIQKKLDSAKNQEEFNRIYQENRAEIESYSPSISERFAPEKTATPIESAVGTAKWVGTQLNALSGLTANAFNWIASMGDEEARKIGEEQIKKSGEEYAKALETSTPGEASVFKTLDIASLIGGGTAPIARDLTKISSSEGVLAKLFKSGLTVSDEVASKIAKASTEEEVVKLLSNDNLMSAPNKSEIASRIRDIRTAKEAEGVSGQVSQVIQEPTIKPTEVSAEVPKVEAPKVEEKVFDPTSMSVTQPTKTMEELGNEAISKAARAVAPEPKRGFVETATKAIKEIPVKMEEALVTRFAQAQKITNEILKTSGIVNKENVLIKELENYTSTKSSAAARLGEFKEDIIDPLHRDGLLEDFKQYLFMKRTGTRLNANVKTGDWTPELFDAGLGMLKSKLGEEKFAKLEGVADTFKVYTDEIVDTMTNSGIISREGAKAMRETNDVYAPFKLIKYIGDGEVARGAGRSMNLSGQDVIRAMKGISDDDIRVSDLIGETAKKLYTSRLIAEKNRIIKDLIAPLADIKGSVITKIRTTENVVERMNIFKELSAISSSRKKIDNLIRTRSKWARELASEIRGLTAKQISAVESGEKAIIRKGIPASDIGERKMASLLGGGATTRDASRIIDDIVKMTDSKWNALQKKILSRNNKLQGVVDTINSLREDAINLKYKSGELRDQAAMFADIERAAKDKGMDVIHYWDDGVLNILEVPSEFAKSIKGMNVQEVGLALKVLKKAIIPARAGTTTLIAGFQATNALSDLLRTATISKFRINNPIDAVKFAYDYGEALVKSFGGNYDDVIKSMTGGAISTKGKLYKEAEKEGIFSGTIMNSFLNELGNKTPDVSTLGKHFTPLDIIDKFGNSIEEATKLTGYKRGAKMLKEGKISKADLLYEIRNFSGSPDFSRGGTLTPAANILFMFFNARMQGMTKDLSRLSGYSDGGKEAVKAWSSMSPMALAVTYNSIRNNTMYKEDMDKLTDWEKSNNIIIFKDSFIKDKDGNYVRDSEGKPLRDAWKIPVRDTIGAIKNLTEAIVDTAYSKDKDVKNKMIDFTGKTIEGFLPVNIQGKNLQERTESIISSSNPLIKSFYEYSSGRDPYRHKEIEPEYMGGEKTANIPKQFRKKDSTPDWAIRLGEWTGQSPLMIEKIANDFGAGMFTQFKGTDQRGNALSKRFIRSVYYKENEDFINTLQGMNEENAVKGIGEYSKAKVIYESIKDAGPEEKKRIITDLIKNGDADESILKEVVKFADKEKFGYSREDSMIRDMPVEDGSRAKAIVLKLDTLNTPEEKKAYIKNAIDKKLITNQVAQQINIIMQMQSVSGK